MRSRTCATAATAVLTLALLPASLGALYLLPEIEQVPVERVVANLETIARQEPQNAEVRVNLARAHAMAYVLGTETLPMSRIGAESAAPWIQPPERWVPFAGLKPGAARERTLAARTHLQAAIDAYEAALRLNPRDPVARLGYGWCLEQSGNRGAAIAAYRAVIPDALGLDRARRSNHVATIVEEAAGYLIPLLDPRNDAEEIARLQAYVVELRGRPRAITPVVVPLGDTADPHALIDHAARVRFDADGRALDGEWTWISPDAGWLVFDPTGTGRITSALQLFGSVTFWMFWTNGYEAMRALDDDQDGVLSGRELQGLAIWRDANVNGRSDPGEVRPVAEWGIVALSTRHDREDESDVHVAWSPSGVTFANGTTRPTYDVLLYRIQVGGETLLSDARRPSPRPSARSPELKAGDGNATPVALGPPRGGAPAQSRDCRALGPQICARRASRPQPTR